MQQRETEDENYATKMEVPQLPRPKQIMCMNGADAASMPYAEDCWTSGVTRLSSHRRVRDFLLSREMSDYLTSKTRSKSSIALWTPRLTQHA